VLTVFSVPKPFTGHTDVIQRNAIASWRFLRPRPEIILFGGETGTASVARELGIRHESEIAVNAHGTPLLNDLFRRAETESSSEIMCYVNADIILLDDFSRGVARVSDALKKFLIVSKRINISTNEGLSFGPDWQGALRNQAETTGTSGGHTSIDVFVFSRGVYPQIPDFGIGRLWFDQWLIKAARASGVPVVDLSRVAPVLHQNHDYNHVPGGAQSIWKGSEAAHNLKLYGGNEHAYTLLDVTHELQPNGELNRVLFRRLRYELWRWTIQKTFPLRRRLGLRRSET
jgi:hypothetical protein